MLHKMRPTFHLVIIFVLICRSQLVITATVPGCENCGCCVDRVCAPAFVQGRLKDDVCTKGCIAGIGGNKCYSKCPDDCVTCEQTTYTNCATCKDGKYLNATRRCLDCPKRCVRQCSSTTGYCESCEGNFHGNLCNECSLGYYGEMCDKDCPEKCSLCPRYSGTCEACNQNYAGPLCDDCVAGRYGQTCDIPCPSMKCSNNICDRETGNCVLCPDGFYGTGCGFNCSPGCNVNTCDFISGACNWCKEPYTGDRCCLEGGHCRNCSSNTVCETCEDGYFGEMCERPCPTTCATYGQYSQCGKSDGKCLSCANGIHGDDTVPIIGIAIGVSSAIIVVVIIVLIFVFLFIFRKWKRKNQLGKEEVDVSYVNLELQSDTPKPPENSQTQHEYEDLGTRNQMDDTEYEELK